MTPEEQTESGTSPEDPDQAEGAGDAQPKQRRTHADRANANLRAAKRATRGEDADPNERLRFLLAEAEVLAMLDLSDALRGGGGEEG